ncbi:MAG TPA: polysaccharide biosynthesis tyrosine autokinase [Candidatus Paceibacterota bacterium]|nr:polysaccharide biosynthesis tyrosine autokinase [Verrucomicrobiota bacterium]HSA12870.1 polysaccharide biosynthesis tyrosine autokinase [Candidatus Paceibacterota bacterium]
MDPLKVAPPQETKLHFLDYWRIIRIRKTVILAVFLLVVITATLVTFILPESFSSSARIKIERDQSDIAELGGRGNMIGYDPYFIQTEFELIQSEVILGKVIEDLDLNREWGKKYASGDRLKTSETITLLKGRIDLRPVRNTSLIEIRVFSEKADEAAKIANAVAEAYKEHRQEQRTRLSKGGIKALEDRFAEQEAKVKKAQEKVETLRKELNISDAMASGDGPSPLMTADTLRKLESLRIESKAAYVQQATLLDRLKNLGKELGPEGLAQAITTASPDELLSSLLEQLSVAEQRLVMLEKEYGPEHAEVTKCKAMASDLHNKIKSRVNGIMLGLDTRVLSLSNSLDNLTQEVNKATTNDVAQATLTRPYFEAKSALEELKRFRQILDAKIAYEKIDVDLPKTMMVEIVDKAVPGLRPVRPNKPLNIALGIIIGLVVGVGLAFFIEYLDTSVKTIDDVERSLQCPVLGVIPQNVGLIMDEGTESPHAEAYRVLRTNLLFSRKDDKLNTIAIVSAGAGEGKSTTVFNLASVFAQSGQRTVIVDSDLRRPTLHKMLRVTNNIGLTNYLLRQNTLEEVIQTTSQPTLDFLASGKLPSSSLGILSSAQMKDLISELKQRYDFVFFDSPPIMGVSDASILASEVDMTMQVIQYRRYPQPMNIRAKQLIEKVGGNLVGIVLNNINMSQDESYYYYSGYYHDYYYRSEDSGQAARADAGTEDKAKLDIKQKY